MTGLFHPPIRPAQPADPNLRQKELVGDGSPYLRAPGLRRLESVRLGGMREPLPLERVVEVPIAILGEKMETTELRLPVVLREEDEEGETYLLRATFSNDGLWSAGERVFVVGEWQEEPEVGNAASDALSRKPGRSG